MNRRSFLKGLLLIFSIFTFKLSSSSKNNISFVHGVASGDPTKNKIILWTRVTTNLNRDVEIQWQMASNKTFSNILNSGIAFAKYSNDVQIIIDHFRLDQ